MVNIWRIFVEYLVSLSRRRKYIVILHDHHISPPLRVSGCYIYRSILWQGVNRAAIARILNVLFMAFCTTTTIFALLNIANCFRGDLSETFTGTERMRDRPDARSISSRFT